MRVRDEDLYNQLHEELIKFSNNIIRLPILDDETVRNVLVNQMIDSVRRVKYAQRLTSLNINLETSLPTSNSFDPLKAAIYHLRQGDTDEAVWLVFLATHFGYSPQCRWLLTRDVYGKLGDSPYWTWDNVSKNLPQFQVWANDLHQNIQHLTPTRKFGNHRKYESLRPDSNRSLFSVISSYVNLILTYNSHQSFFSHVLGISNNNPHQAFNHLYNSMNSVVSFGRTSKFDFLSMLGKLGIVNIEPPMTYMQGSTGPSSGARLLFGQKNSSELEDSLFILQENLSINPFGMQVLEDALCNWQKNINTYIYFNG